MSQTPGDVVISEIMYNPISTPQADNEYVEIVNASGASFTLTNAELTTSAGSSSQFNINLSQNESVILTPLSAAAFQAKWGSGTQIITLSTWPNLENIGDVVTLSENGVDIDVVEYANSDPWPPSITASISSIFLDLSMSEILANGNTLNNDGCNWKNARVNHNGGRQSNLDDDIGSPGVVTQTTETELGQLVITEIMYEPFGTNNPGESSQQWIEIYNTTSTELDLNGYSLIDFSNDYQIQNFASYQLSGAISANGVAIVGFDTAQDFLQSFGDCNCELIFVNQQNRNAFEEFGCNSSIFQIRDNNNNLLDEVNLRDSAPWPTGVNGQSVYFNESIENVNSNSAISNNDGANWNSSTSSDLGTCTSISAGVFQAGNVASPGNINGDALIEPLFSAFPDFSVCTSSGLPQLNTLPTSDDEGLEGTWSSEDDTDLDGNQIRIYTFIADDEACYITYSFTVTVQGEIEVTFSNLLSEDVCASDELPLAENQPQPEEAEVTGFWSVEFQDNDGDGQNDEATYSFTITSQPANGCYVNPQPFTLVVLDEVDELTFSDLPLEDVCQISELPAPQTLPQPDQTDVQGLWTRMLSDTDGDGSDDLATYSFNVESQPSGICYANPEPFEIQILDAEEITFNDLPSDDVCDLTDLPEAADLPPPNENGVTGSWVRTLIDSDGDGVDDSASYLFTITTQPDGSCFISPSAFTLQVVDNVVVTFTSLPTFSVCEEDDFPDPESLPQPDQDGVTGSWSQQINGDNDSATYTFTIENQPTGGCFVAPESFTVVIEADVEVFFFDFEFYDVCSEEQFLDIDDLPPPAQDGVEGNWEREIQDTDNDGNADQATYTFTITSQPADGCYVNPQPVVVLIVGDITVTFTNMPDDEVCRPGQLPQPNTLPQPDQGEVSGTWARELVDNTGDGEPDFGIYTFSITQQPENGCFISPEPYTITVVGDIQITFPGLPLPDVCTFEELIHPSDMPDPNEEGVTGIWEWLLRDPNNDGVIDFVRYNYRIQGQPEGACYETIDRFRVYILGEVPVEFEELPPAYLCFEEDLPALSDLPDPTDEEIAGTWSENLEDIDGDGGIDIATYTFTIDSAPENSCTVNPEPYVIEVSGETPVSFEGLPLPQICTADEFPDVSIFPGPVESTVTGTWSVEFTDADGDGSPETGSYQFTIDNQPDESCFVDPNPYVIEVSGEIEVPFNLPPAFVCNETELPSPEDMPSPIPTGVTGFWIQTLLDDNNDGVAEAATYEFTISSQPSEGCYVDTQPYTIEVADNVEVTFDFPPLEVCSEPDLPALEDLPQPNETGVSGDWSVVDNGNETFTYSFTITEQPETTCYTSEEQYTIAITNQIVVTFSDLPTNDVCSEDELPSPEDLPQPNQPGVTGLWAVSDNGDDSYTVRFTIEDQPDNGCYVNPEPFIIQVLGLEFPTFDIDDFYCDDDTPALLPTTSDNGLAGMWTPAEIDTNQIGETDYVFEGFDDCIDPFVLTVTVLPQTVPTFSIPDEVCIRDESPLVNESLEGITGTWSPAYDAENTMTYTFTPDPDQCASSVEHTVEIIEVFPSFDVGLEYCEQETTNALPTTSLEGVEGSWQPALIDTSTLGESSYTFVPDEDECAEVVTININILPLSIAEFTLPVTYCIDTNPQELPTTAENGVTGTWQPELINTSVAGDQTYTFTPAGDCVQLYELNVTITARDTPTFNLPAELCLGSESPFAPTSLENIMGVWSPAFDPINTTTYTFTPNEDECAVSIEHTISIQEVIPIFDFALNYCVDDEAFTLPLSSLEGITGSWSPAFISTNVVGDATYTFTPDIGQCARAQNFIVTTTALSEPTFTLLDRYCFGDSVEQLPTTSTDGVEGIWFPAQIETNAVTSSTYTFTPNVGSCALPFELIVVVDPCGCVFEQTFIDTACQGEEYLLPDGTAADTSQPGVFAFETITVVDDDCDIREVLSLQVNGPEFPTAFSPLATNGMNDEFNILLTEDNCDVTNYHLQVFDRWGELVFETNDHNLGWNGSVMGSQEQRQGLFLWQAEFEINGMAITRNGTVQIIH